MRYFTLIILMLSFNADARDCGRMNRIKGDVDILRLKSDSKDNTRVAVAAQAKSALRCDDIVVTGRSSRAVLRLKGKGGVLTMGPLARIEIETYKSKASTAKDTQSLKLLYGKVRALIKKQDQVPIKKNEKSSEGNDDKGLGYRLRITTPSAVAGVRGTDFFVSHNANTAITEQATIEGTVEVQRAVKVDTPKSSDTKVFEKPTSQVVKVTGGKQVTVASVGEVATKTPEKKKEKTETPAPVLPPLKVVPIVPEVLDEIRQTSTLVQNDKEFVSKEAVEVLGEPETWTPPPDELPLDLKDLKEEF